MNAETVQHWEAALRPEQHEQLAALRARKCSVEAQFVPSDEERDRPPLLRLRVIADSFLLASHDEARSVTAAFEAVYNEAMQRLRLPEP